MTDTSTQIAPADAALNRLERLQGGFGDLTEVYAAAVVARDWEALGMSLADWQASIFSKTRLTAEARKQVARLLSAEGQTLKEISEATGTSTSTAGRDVSQTGINPFENVKPSRSVTRRRPRTPAERQADRRTRLRNGKAADKAPDPVVPAPDPVVPAPDPEPENARLSGELAAAEGKAAALAAQLEALQEENAELRARVTGLEDQLERVTGERDFFRDQMRQAQQQLREGGSVPAIPDPWQDVKVPGMLPPLEPRPWTAAADGPWEDFNDIMRMGEPAPDPAPDPVTGPCARCGNPGRPVLVDGTDDGRFCCDPCFAELSAARPGMLSRLPC